jgi:hypothetical protein
MNASAIQYEPYEVPDGGLASFLTATEGAWSDAELEGPETDYAIELAGKLAGYGREGDTALAHVAPGETVIPMEVFSKDPELKNRLFERMRDMGLEPERYVVGNELNSINPVTGQPEFFLKKLVKGVKKAVKGVVKVFKKIAPIVLPIALNLMFPGLGAIASGALGSGIGTLVQGGSLKDAFKSALIGGAVGGLASGVSGAMNGQGFVEGLKGGLPGGNFGGLAPTQAPIETGVPISDVAGGAQVAQQQATQALAPPPPAAVVPPGADPSMAVSQSIADVNPLAAPAAAPAPRPNMLQSLSDQTGGALGGGLAPSTQTAATSLKPPGFFESIKAGNFKEAFLPSAPDIDAVLQQKFGKTLMTASPSQIEAAKTIVAEMAPKMLRQYGPMAGLGLGAMYLAGGFDAPEQPELQGMYGGVTGMDLLQQDPTKYRVGQPNFGPYSQQAIGAANGGSIESFSRRNGAIYGPGTETSDDIPAMLSDGEFVMTARAVRGLGGGDRQQGMRKMYDLMRRFEGGAVNG